MEDKHKKMFDLIITQENAKLNHDKIPFLHTWIKKKIKRSMLSIQSKRNYTLPMGLYNDASPI